MNPFKYGRVVSDDDFCQRPELLTQLAAFIRSGQNVVIQGERRMGKTSLIYEVARKMKRRMLYVDLLEIKTTDDLCKRIVKAVISLEQQMGLLEKIVKTLAQLRPTVSIDPLSGQPTISLDASVSLRPDSIDGLLDLISGIHKRKHLVVVFDEFQDVLNLSDNKEVLAALRSKIQFHKDIPYVFAGSVRNKMSDIFADPASPFFKAAIPIEVGPLGKNDFVRFLNKKFKLGKRAVDVDVLEKITEIAEDVPGDMQELCGALWEITSYSDHISSSDISAALELIYARESKGYETALVQLTGHQLKCLIGIASMGGKAPQSSAFVRGVGLTLAASVKKAINRLIQLKIIYRYKGDYKFVNPFFKSWLLWKGY